MLIIAGWAWTDGVFTQSGIERLAMQVGEFVQERLGLGLGGEDAADRRQGEGAEADGAFQGREHVVTPIVGQQCQQLLRLQLALDLLGEQAVEELHGDGAEFAEALPQEQRPLVGIVGGMMALDRLAARRSRCRARADGGRFRRGRSSR